MDWRITDPAHLLGSLRVSLCEGGRFLTGRITPDGPILDVRNVSYVHKSTWGMYSAGVDHGTIARLLDWARDEALRENGDFFFPEEGPEYKDYQRVYRPLNFLRIAAWIGHPLARDARVIDRVMQYRHEPSGGVFHFIGDDAQNPDPPESFGTLNTTFFGHLMIALDNRAEAIATADWVVRWVDANRPHMSEGRMYTQMTPEGRLCTDVAPGEKIGKVVDTQSPKQEFWNPGTAMAYLAYLYDVMLTDWDAPAAEARPYLEAALALLDFEATMPLDTYLWPSKCKVGWGAGELLRVLVKYGELDQDEGEGARPGLEKAYRVAERVALFTFLDNQLPGGGWPWMHYPLSERIPEMALSYKPLKNTLAVPPGPIAGSETIFLSSEEITGEFLGEMKAIEQGVAALVESGTGK